MILLPRELDVLIALRTLVGARPSSIALVADLPRDVVVDVLGSLHGAGCVYPGGTGAWGLTALGASAAEAAAQGRAAAQ